MPYKRLVNPLWTAVEEVVEEVEDVLLKYVKNMFSIILHHKQQPVTGAIGNDAMMGLKKSGSVS